jgi:xylulokinase
MYYIGYDAGSSSVKAALINAANGLQVAVVQSPDLEMGMDAPNPGWAEQDPDLWWRHLCLATRKLLQATAIKADDIAGVGISYQMHGLVMVDSAGKTLRPAIIWCDSRAVEIGDNAFSALGAAHCLTHLLNSPGNFTASKLRWVQENEPGIYRNCFRCMLPGDYLAMRLTGEMTTTPGGLSEGILWDFSADAPAEMLMSYYAIEPSLLPPLVRNFEVQGRITPAASEATGLPVGIPLTYRAGDQPNNALSLNVLHPGEVAATGGTSGVVYGVSDRPVFDPQSRVNGFLHVNHTAATPRIGVLLCLNGAGILYSWVRSQITGSDLSYRAMEQMAATVPAGSDGLSILPFGNGAERILANRAPGAHFSGLQFNRHTQAHIARAALEGIAFALAYGMEIMQNMGITPDVLRVGNDNLFQSAVFSQTLANCAGSRIEVFDTTGAYGAARAAAAGAGAFSSLGEAMNTLQAITRYAPEGPPAVNTAFEQWKAALAFVMQTV